nr:hypothetical protein [Streptomyces sp. 846.5]
MKLDRSWLWFGAWVLVGGGYALALASLLTIGVFVLALTAAATVLLATRRGALVGLPGALSGPALPLLWIANLNRGGPGTVCSGTPEGGSCTDEWSPWLFLVPGVLLLIAGVVLFLVVRRRTRATNSTGAGRNVPPGPGAWSTGTAQM